jgi:hypothetical protein
MQGRQRCSLIFLNQEKIFENGDIAIENLLQRITFDQRVLHG